MRELSLFTGAGGGILGTHLLGWTPIGYVEWNDYCQRVLAARIADGLIPEAPIFGDIREFVESGAALEYRGFADVVTAGFPCQPFSVAGKQKGADDERNMWPATRDVICDVKPSVVMLENVPGLLTCGYAAIVIAELAAMGYVGQTGCIRASDTGAFHHRDRWWVVAHADSGRRRTDIAGRNDADRPNAGRKKTDGLPGTLRPASGAKDLADPDCGNAQGIERERANEDQRQITRERPTGLRGGRLGKAWAPEPDVGRVVNGLAKRVDRIKALGNGQVPRVVAAAWELLK